MPHPNRVPWWPLVSLLFLLLALVSLFSLAVGATSSATLTDPSTGEVVLLTPGRMHSSVAASASVIGLWPHGDGHDDDARFFKVEDDAYRRWVARKKQKQLEQQQQQHQQGKKNGGGEVADDQGDDVGTGKNEKPKKAFKSMLEFFSSESVRSRANARNQRLKELKNSSSLEPAWREIRSEADFVRQLLYDDSNFSLNGNPKGTPEEQYAYLLQTAFRHTVRNMTGDNAFLWTKKWFCALPYPMVLDGEVVRNAEREVRSIHEAMNKIRSTALLQSENMTDLVEDVNLTMTPIRESLRDSREILKASRVAHNTVNELVLPLMADVRQSVSTQLQDVNANIVGNDESTVLLRQQLKEWTKRKSILKTSNGELAKVERELRKAVYGNTLLPAKTFILSLALIAKVRLGENTGIESVDVITNAGGTCITLTAAKYAEFKSTLYHPMGMSLVLLAAMGWVLLGTRDFWLRRVQLSSLPAQQAPNSGGHSRRQTSFARLCVRVNLLIEALLPFIIPIISFYWAFKNKKKDVSPYSILVFSRPMQRLVWMGVVVVLCITNIVVFGIVSALYGYSSGPSPRKKLKKQ